MSSNDMHEVANAAIREINRKYDNYVFAKFAKIGYSQNDVLKLIQEGRLLRHRMNSTSEAFEETNMLKVLQSMEMMDIFALDDDVLFGIAQRFKQHGNMIYLDLRDVSAEDAEAALNI